ncbi:MAG: tRNA (N(6)-L-threonylcarbamoyladenosine(37)-C(2))-methylthiotransferase MtaB [Clostridia bacterium]|nr:tRNA (N(6)-L-threonylcarbamoyladenosine(37)-C(2))-methylthiotransferase MtaB [Clostridia bacterium]
MKVKFFTLGCKVNQFESQAMIRQLSEHGYETASEDESADITVINSCAVTAASEQKAMKLLRRIRRETPDTVIVLTGCMAQTVKDSGKLGEVDIILGNKRRSDIIPVLEEYFSGKKKMTFVEQYQKHDDYENLIVDDFSERTRAFLKIEDGCNRFCSYCIIPYARGRVRSSSVEYIKKEVEGFAKNGYKEVVLVGINLSCYGSDNGHCFSDAVKTACEAADVRIRLGSLEPESMDLETLKIFAEQKNFCPQFHLSLQSGCDETLKRMNRHYTTAEYEKIVSDIRSVFENAAITTDIMVGFAGETDEEFQKSMAFVEKIGFAKVHIFPYSRRPGTAADKAPNQLSNDIKKKRAALMAEAAGRARKKFLASQVGRTEKVLIEARNKNGKYEGYTPNYTLVYVEADDSDINTVVDVKITTAENDYCTGEKLCTVQCAMCNA